MVRPVVDSFMEDERIHRQNIADTVNRLSAAAGIAQAHCTFDPVAPAIRSSENVTSVTDTGTGDFTINLTAAFNTASFTSVTGGKFAGNGSTVQIGSQTTTACRILTFDFSPAAIDAIEAYWAAFGNLA